MTPKNSGPKRRAKGYTISAVADHYGIHQQTLRLYEREGLLKPSRSEGNVRLYTDEDLERLDVILKLTRDLGVNLAGVEIILNMRERWTRCSRNLTAFSECCAITWPTKPSSNTTPKPPRRWFRHGVPWSSNQPAAAPSRSKTRLKTELESTP